MSDKKPIKPLVETNQRIRFQTSGRGSLLNLTKARIITQGNGSINMNMEKGGVTMMTLI